MSFNYDSIPAGYYFRAMNSGALPQRFWHRNKFLQVLAVVPPGAGELLDIGCAAGSLAYIASQVRPALRITGVDISEAQIEFANAFVAPGVPGARFQSVAPGPLPFEDAAFDVVTTVELIEHLDRSHCEELAREVHRLLRPGGTWVITTPNYMSHWPLLEILLEARSPVKYGEQHITKFSPRILKKFVEKHGFKVDFLRKFFVIAPFVSWLGGKLADLILLIEMRLKLPGCLILLRCIKQ